jgi:hypothetical protein
MRRRVCHGGVRGSRCLRRHDRHRLARRYDGGDPRRSLRRRGDLMPADDRARRRRPGSARSKASARPTRPRLARARPPRFNLAFEQPQTGELVLVVTEDAALRRASEVSDAPWPCSARRVPTQTWSCERPGVAGWSFVSCDRSSCASTCARAFPPARPRAQHRRDARPGDSGWSAVRPCDRSRSHLALTYPRPGHAALAWVASPSASSLCVVARSGTPVPWLPWSTA